MLGECYYMFDLIVFVVPSGIFKLSVEQFQRCNPKLHLVKKYTTRKKIANEWAEDLFFASDFTTLQACDYTYSYFNHIYGFKHETIDEIRNSNGIPVLVIPRCSILSELKKKYSNILSVYVISNLSGDDLEIQLKEKYHDPISFEDRKKWISISVNDYIQYLNKNLFNYVLIQTFDDNFIKQLEILFSEISGNDHFKSENRIFVAMPFEPGFDETYSAIQLAVDNVESLRRKKIGVERIDKSLGTFDIVKKIKTDIQQAEVVICDLSNNNPNVFYEVGLAQAYNRHIIYLSNGNNPLPFDVSHYKTIFYKSAIELQRKLIEELRQIF